MIKAIDLVWTEETKPIFCEFYKSQLFSFGKFIIKKRLSTDHYHVSLSLFNHISIMWDWSDNFEQAKQTCQDYLQQIAEEIVKC